MPKNYYIILGIPSDSSSTDIKSAYRKLAKEFHPDHCGKKASPFLNIQEAYSVLSDPVRRQSYDEKLKVTQRGMTKSFVEPMQQSFHEEKIEPLIPEPLGPTDLGNAYLSNSFHHCRPSFDSLFDNIFSNFLEHQPKGGELKNLNVVITLNPEQAFLGGHVRLFVPTQLKCPRCNGYGGIGYYECWHCGGEGIKSGEHPVMISFPPGVSDNHSVQLSLDQYGIHNLYLTVTFRISEMG